MAECSLQEKISPIQIEEKPDNGLSGLKHWRQDLLAGLVVALVSVPLSLGIAIASGAPPICGITSEIIAGLVFPFLGGAYVTVSGPAAGLAPVILSSMLQLGHGDTVLGYHRIVCVIMLVGVLQIVLTYMKAAKFSHLFPSAAIQGMLASIGLMLVMKQMPNFLGQKFHGHEFFEMAAEIPACFAQTNWSVFALSAFCLALLFGLNAIKSKWMRIIPPQLIVVVVGAALGSVINIDPKFLVHAPANPFEHGFVMPDFAALFADRSVWGAVFSCMLLLAFVDGTESLATIHAVDRIDPFHRKSNPDRTLMAMGISNICSSLIGGLTIIPGIIKSTTCIVSGGRTAWVNFYNALFLIAFLVFGAGLLDRIPLSALSAVLVHIGYKLAGPHKWKHVSSIGVEQLAIFVVTIFVTLKTDLMFGIFAGMGVKLLIVLFYAKQGSVMSSTALAFSAIFKNPVVGLDRHNENWIVKLEGPLTCFNSLWLRQVLDHVPDGVKNVRVELGPTVSVVDHSVNLYLYTHKGDLARVGIQMDITGLDSLRAMSSESTSFKFREMSTANAWSH